MPISHKCWMILLVVVAVHTVAPGFQPGPARRFSQSQTASQFLRAILRADYVAAYKRLAPEVRRTVSLTQFEGAARPLWKRAPLRHREIELYKLGLRLGQGGGSRLFYDFSFAADSALKVPPALLEVTFRDTASRVVLGFGLRANGPTKPSKLPTKALKQ